MTHIWQGLRSGAWLTATRARGYSVILLGICTVAMAGWVIVSDVLTDLNGKPIGTDFSSFYAAGSMALEGHAANAYDIAAHYARQQQIFGARTPYYAWFYPPFLLFVAAPLALLPYPAALVIWQAATLAFYVGVSAPSCNRSANRVPILAISGYCSRWPFRRSSSISDMARTAF